MQINLHHSLIYTTRGQVPVSLVAKSLLANEQLIYESLRLLEGMDKEITIQSIQVSVSNLSNQSPLREGLAIAVYLAYQDRLEAEVSDILKAMTGSDGNSVLVTVLIIFLAIYLIDAAIERLFPGKSVKAIQAEYEEKKEMVARLLKVSPEYIEDEVNRRYAKGRSKSLTTKVFDFFAPAKIESGVEIQGQAVMISSEAIHEIPNVLDFTMLDRTHSYPVEGVTIEIHRADIDENKHGWRAVIPDVSNKKTRMELDQTIRPDEIYGCKTLKGDVLVVEELNDEGAYVIKAYILVRVIAVHQ